MVKNSKTVRRGRSQKRGFRRSYTYRQRGGTNVVLQQKMAEVKSIAQEIMKRKEELGMLEKKFDLVSGEMDKLLSGYD